VTLAVDPESVVWPGVYEPVPLPRKIGVSGKSRVVGGAPGVLMHDDTVTL
jgi:hypothetical protein